MGITRNDNIIISYIFDPISRFLSNIQISQVEGRATVTCQGAITLHTLHSDGLTFAIQEV